MFGPMMSECHALSWKFRKFGTPESRLGVAVIQGATGATGGLKIRFIYKATLTVWRMLGEVRARDLCLATLIWGAADLIFASHTHKAVCHNVLLPER